MIFYRCDMCNTVLREKDCCKVVFEDRQDHYHVCFDCNTKLRHLLSEYAPRCGTCHYLCHSSISLCVYHKDDKKPVTNEYNICCNWKERV